MQRCIAGTQSTSVNCTCTEQRGSTFPPNIFDAHAHTHIHTATCACTRTQNDTTHLREVAEVGGELQPAAVEPQLPQPHCLPQPSICMRWSPSESVCYRQRCSQMLLINNTPAGFAESARHTAKATAGPPLSPPHHTHTHLPPRRHPSV